MISQEALTLAWSLLAYVLKTRPDGLATSDEEREEAAQAWGAVFERMLTKERRVQSEVMALIHWSQRDAVWKKRIRSAAALRKHYTALVAARSRTPASSGPAPFVAVAEREKEREVYGE